MAYNTGTMQTSRWISIKKRLIWSLWVINIILIIILWYGVNAESTLPIVSIARLCGLLATFGALVQLTLMSRARWIEPLFGMDRLARFHRLNGYATFFLLLAHPLLLSVGYTSSSDIISTYFALLALPFVPLALTALIVFCITVGFTIYIVRKHLRFETWYFIHFMNYIAIILLPWHQFNNGGSLQQNDWLRYYWIGIYAVALLNVVIWRFGIPIYKSLKYSFRVDKVVSEGPRANSVYITGNNLESYKARGGQFVLVRFFQKGLWWQEHPFSLSQLPSKVGIRNTVRELGDFTSAIKDLKPGTRVLVSGPYGAFTLDKARHEKILYIAGGIGITPIRSMIEEAGKNPELRDSILLYANKTSDDIALKSELEQLARSQPLTIHHILSDDTNATEKGFVDTEKIARLVPDVNERSIFLCGPPPMMRAVISSLQELGVNREDIHYEYFSFITK